MVLLFIITQLPPELMTPNDRAQYATGRITLTPPQARQLEDVARLGGINPDSLRRALESTTFTLGPGGRFETSSSNLEQTTEGARARDFLTQLLPLGIVRAENGRLVAELSPSNVVTAFMSMGRFQTTDLLQTSASEEVRVAMDSLSDRFMPRGDRTENRAVVTVASSFIERCRNIGLNDMATTAENYVSRTYGAPAAALVRGIALHTTSTSVAQNNLFMMSNPDVPAIRHEVYLAIVRQRDPFVHIALNQTNPFENMSQSTSRSKE